MASFQDRVIGALKGQESTFTEVRNDPAAMSHAALIVAASGVARTISLVLSPLFLFTPILAIGGIVTALVGWAIGSVVLWAVGTKIIPGRAGAVDIPTVMRTTGFAFVPLIAMVLSFIPLLGGLIALAAGLWSLYLFVLAARAAFDYADIAKAVLACVIAIVITWVGFIVLSIMFATLGMAGLFMLGR